jgi:hypothetical protein
MVNNWFCLESSELSLGDVFAYILSGEWGKLDLIADDENPTEDEEININDQASSR